MEVVSEKLVVVNANVCSVFITWKTKIFTNIMMKKIKGIVILLMQDIGGLLATAVDKTFFKIFNISEKLLRVGFASTLMLSFSFICNAGIVTTGSLGKGKVLKFKQSHRLSLCST